jgi:glucose/arabinose dehydrogenase
MKLQMKPLGAACALAFLLTAVLPICAADAPPEISVPPGFSIEIIAHVDGARELAAAPNGDLFVGTLGSSVDIISEAEGNPGTPRTFARLGEAPDAGVALGDGALYVGTNGGVWRIPYAKGSREPAGQPVKIASVRTGGRSGHSTTSVALANGRLYASVGSSCDACTESDPTRATIQEMDLDGHGMRAKAIHIRNAIALAVNPATNAVWAGVAGQDALEHGHPYEIFDPFTLHSGTVDYGWPYCYDNRKATDNSHGCTDVQVPRVVFPGYDTPIGAAIYPTHATGRYAFPAQYAGGAFVGLHGSWHRPLVPPRVAFVPLRNDEPAKPVDWADPSAQWHEFVRGFQRPDESRVGRPTGIAVGPLGSLFVADDQAGVVYRIRPKR